MSEMVERVARAICAVHVADDPGELEEMSPYWQDAYRAMARAAIEAMREPTDAMITAGDGCCGIYTHGKNTWQAMIDEILK